jgi:hypothetical protein
MASVRERYGEAFWRAHHGAWQQSALNQREYLRGTRDSAEGFRQLASEVQSRAAATGPQTAVPAPGYGCRACGNIHRAPAPERPIGKGLASPALLAHVLVAKYGGCEREA